MIQHILFCRGLHYFWMTQNAFIRTKYSIFWFDMVWSVMIWHDMHLQKQNIIYIYIHRYSGLTLFDRSWYDTMWHKMFWFDLVLYGMSWYDLIKPKVFSFDMVRDAMICSDLIWYDKSWCDMICYATMLWHDMISWTSSKQSCHPSPTTCGPSTQQMRKKWPLGTSKHRASRGGTSTWGEKALDDPDRGCCMVYGSAKMFLQCAVIPVCSLVETENDW